MKVLQIEGAIFETYFVVLFHLTSLLLAKSLECQSTNLSNYFHVTTIHENLSIVVKWFIVLCDFELV